MKNSQALSAERSRELFSYDPDSGNLFRAGYEVPLDLKPGTNGYIYVRIGRVKVLAHRLAWLLQTGSMPKGVVDHVNGARSDNRWANLRDVPQSVNCENRASANCRKLDLPLGVSARGTRFSAQITTGGKQRKLGYFGDPEQAHQAYLKAKRELHVGCTI